MKLYFFLFLPGRNLKVYYIFIIYILIYIYFLLIEKFV